MDNVFALENSSSAAVNTLPNTTIYLTTAKYFNTRLRLMHNGPCERLAD